MSDPKEVPVTKLKPKSILNLPTADRPGGLATLAGLFRDWDTIDVDIERIIASRRRAGQPSEPQLD
jgi:hypothetical protein